MTTTFKTGDKDKHDTRGNGEITYGPLAGQDGYYIMKAENGTETSVNGAYLTPRAAFAVGDKATGASTGTAYEILAGPFKYGSDTWYAARHADGQEMKLSETNLKPLAPADDAIKAGDRIRVTTHRADGATVSTGDEFTVRRLVGLRSVHTVEGNSGNGWFFSPENVEKISSADTFIYDGITYDLSAKYRDKDGDVWTLARVGSVVRGGIGHVPTYSSESLTEVVDEYGPLRKV